MIYPGADAIKVLFSQKRYKDAEVRLRQLIAQYPTLGVYKFYLAFALKFQSRFDEADEIVQVLLSEDPTDEDYIELQADLDIDQDRLVVAEEKIKGLLSREYIKDEYYLMLARIKFKQNNYDRALEYVDEALALDSENLDALNMRSAITGIMGHESVGATVMEALNQDPNNSYAIANHANQLLRDGQVKKALERYKEALAIDPENELARYGLIEAMKAKFWPYRILSKYEQFSSKLSGDQSWAFIIVSYLVYRFLFKTAENNPELAIFLYPLVGLIFLFFISTWILSPLMNFVLLSNPYGRLLLDKDDKLSASLTGLAFGLTLLTLPFWYLWGSKYMVVAICFFLMMIPLGTMFSIPGVYQKRARIFGAGICIYGLVAVVGGIITDNMVFCLLFFGAVFVYQILINKWAIKTYGRVFDD